MFKLTPKSSVYQEADVTITKIDDNTLSVNDEIYDFSQLQEKELLSAQATGCLFFMNDITRINGDICIDLRLPHNTWIFFIKPDETLEITENGPITLPEFGKDNLRRRV